eukprot:Partr_v1_DN26020_c1_g1_i2_m382
MNKSASTSSFGSLQSNVMPPLLQLSAQYGSYSIKTPNISYSDGYGLPASKPSHSDMVNRYIDVPLLPRNDSSHSSLASINNDQSISTAALSKNKTSGSTIGTANSVYGPLGEMRVEKVAELGKKVKSLNLALERERSENSDLKNHIQRLEDLIQDRDIKEEEGNNKASGSSEVDILRIKLEQSLRKYEQQQVRAEAYKREVQISRNILKAEVGPFKSLGELKQLTSDTPTWRGRAQQISLLKDKLHEMERRVAVYESGAGTEEFTRLTDQAAGSNSVRLLADELEKANEEIARVQEVNQKLKQKGTATKARIRSLEDTVQQLKAKLQTVLEKTALDDQMITRLKHDRAVMSRQINQQEREYQ